MVTFARGLDAEDRIQTKLKTYGCSLQSNPTLNHQHKLDFVVTQFPETQKFHSIGVQVTQRLNHHEKLQEFYQAHSDERRVTERSIYIELSPCIDLEAGGSLAVFNVLTSFAFDQHYAGHKAIGAIINNDLSYSLFDIQERVTELVLAVEKANNGPSVAVTTQMATTLQAALAGRLVPVSGYIHAFSRAKNIGFITANDGSTYFLRRSAVIDDRLDVKLNSLAYSDKPLPTKIYVRFVDLGKERPDANYKSAGKAELATEI